MRLHCRERRGGRPRGCQSAPIVPVENRLHWCMDIAFNDDRMRARTRHAAHNRASLKQLTLNLIRMDAVKRKGGIKARRIMASTSDNYRAHLLGLG